MHLKPEELIDIAEGTREEQEFSSHLASCDSCRRQLSDLRTTMTSLGDDPVPEPSPLYWDHFQQRVATAISSETPSRRTAWFWWPAAPGLAVAALVLVSVTPTTIDLPPLPNGPVQVTRDTPPSGSYADGSSRVELLNDSMADADPSLQLVADLTATVDDSGLAPEGSAEHAITHLNGVELRELHRLLETALKRPGA